MSQGTEHAVIRENRGALCSAPEILNRTGHAREAVRVFEISQTNKEKTSNGCKSWY